MALDEIETRETATSDTTSVKSKPSDLTELGKYLHGPRDISSIAIVGIFLLALVAFLYFAKPFLMPVVLALLLHFLLKPVVRALARLRIPEWIGAGIVLAFFIGATTTGLYLVNQPAADWIAKAPESLRQVERKVHDLIKRAEFFTKAAERMGEITKPPGTERAQKIEITRFNLADTLLSYTQSILAGGLETIVLLYFLLASGDLFMRKVVKVMPTARDKDRAVEIVHEVQHNISMFLFTITIINACLGLIVGLAVSLIGMPNPVLWGVMAGFLNFIPYFGPLTGAIIFALAGLLTFESVGQAMTAPVAYLGLHAIEANFITPTVLGRRLTLSPLVIFMALIFWTWLWGIPGALLSVPLLMTLKIFCDHFKPLHPIGELISG